MESALTRRQMIGVAVVASAFAVTRPRALGALEIGARAPDFDLPATTGGNMKLSQFRGKQPVLIEFYGNDFAPV